MDLEYSMLGYNFLDNGIQLHKGYYNELGEVNCGGGIEEQWLYNQAVGNKVYSLPWRLLEISDSYGENMTLETNLLMELNEKNILVLVDRGLENEYLRSVVKEKLSDIFVDSYIEPQNPFEDNDILQDSDIILMFETNYGKSPNVASLFKGLETSDEEYLNVKMVNGQLLSYLKANNREKIIKYLKRFKASDFLKEGYTKLK